MPAASAKKRSFRTSSSVAFHALASIGRFQQVAAAIPALTPRAVYGETTRQIQIVARKTRIVGVVVFGKGVPFTNASISGVDGKERIVSQ
jgi:hypothetical protein